MAVLDQPGSLLGALQPLAARGINLHKLESRPMRGKPFEYVIYVDVMVAGDDPGLGEALEEIAGHTSHAARARFVPGGRRTLRSRSATSPIGCPAWPGAPHVTPLARRFRSPSSCSRCCWSAPSTRVAGVGFGSRGSRDEGGPVRPAVHGRLTIGRPVGVAGLTLSPVALGGRADPRPDQHGVPGDHDVPGQRDAGLLRRGTGPAAPGDPLELPDDRRALLGRPRTRRARASGAGPGGPGSRT